MKEPGGLHILDDIGEALVTAGIVSADQLAVAQETKRNLGGDLGHIMVKKGFVTQEQILEFLSHRLNVPFISLKEYAIDPEIVKLVPASMVQKYHFMPLYRIEDTLTIALSDPLDVFAIDDIRQMLKYRIQPVLAPAQEIEELIQENFHAADVEEQQGEVVEVMQYGAETAEEVADRLRELASGTKVIGEVNRILMAALHERASDIHIEPMQQALRVRNRVDGLLEERMMLPKAMHLPIVSRIKVVSGMDIAERRIPQDGRVRLKIHGVFVDMRVSTYPTMYGEKVVIRLLGQEKILGLEELGFAENDRRRFEALITKPYGIFLVTGPTGSGKTTTLYAALQRINSQDRNIISIEDPIENEIPSVNQAQVNVRAGMTFASALRSILRQDPDVIMIGEIRDQETADIAVRAAITGHLVFSTLHTNTAIGAITRLSDLGVEPFLISSGLIGVIAQRLVRRICRHCAQPVKIEADRKAILGIPPAAELKRGKGCKHCRMSGFAGRIGLFEFVVITPELKQLITDGAGEEAMTALSRRQGAKSLRDQGVELVLAGKTTIEEVLRVTEM